MVERGTCSVCGGLLPVPYRGHRTREYDSLACKQKAYRLRLRAAAEGLVLPLLSARDGAALTCFFAGRGRPYCAAVATHQRSTIPLCDPCEERASSLKRLPLRALGSRDRR